MLNGECRVLCQASDVIPPMHEAPDFYEPVERGNRNPIGIILIGKQGEYEQPAVAQRHCRGLECRAEIAEVDELGRTSYYIVILPVVGQKLDQILLLQLVVNGFFSGFAKHWQRQVDAVEAACATLHQRPDHAGSTTRIEDVQFLGSSH